MYDLPDYQTFLSPDRLRAFWGFVKYLLFYIAPIVMIWVAMEYLGRFISVIRGVYDDDRRRRDDDDEDDYW